MEGQDGPAIDICPSTDFPGKAVGLLFIFEKGMSFRSLAHANTSGSRRVAFSFYPTPGYRLLPCLSLYQAVDDLVQIRRSHFSGASRVT
jgi:hypothetical protein